MYKLFIVDDEPGVRHGLKTYVDWSSYGIEAVGDAPDGLAAMDLIAGIKPDIILTDVRMPNMDGIEMSNMLRERYPEMKIVFISGHDDVEYLKSALRVNAVDYIFKPVNMYELQTVMERITAELDDTRSQQKLMHDMSVQLKESMPLLRDKFLISLIRDGISTPQKMQERLEFLGLKLPQEAVYWVLVVSLDTSIDTDVSRTERDYQLMSYAIINVCEELMQRQMDGYVFENRRGEYVLILHADKPEEREERLFQLAQDIRENLDRWLKLGVTIGVGGQVVQIADLPQSYAQANEAVNQRWHMGRNRIISFDTFGQEEESFQRFDKLQSEQIEAILRAGDSGRLPGALEPLFAKLAVNRRDGFAYCRMVCLQLIVLANRLFMEMNLTPEDSDALLWEKVFKQETVQELQQVLEDYLIKVCSQVHEKRTKKSNLIIERIRSVLETRYAENVTVVDIAKEVYMTKTYVCLLFKQETGETIHEALTKVRIERAKELLLDPRNKFYDVSYAVGYADPSYFSKLFKKYTGETPSSYRG